MQTYQVTGIHCASCVVKIEKALQGVPGVTKATVNFATETTSVDGEVPMEILAAAIARVGGYTLAPVES
jgi:Cu+-exporting ATPase